MQRFKYLIDRLQIIIQEYNKSKQISTYMYTNIHMYAYIHTYLALHALADPGKGIWDSRPSKIENGRFAPYKKRTT